MGLKWPKYVLKIKLKMLIMDKKANFTQYLLKRGEKHGKSANGGPQKCHKLKKFFKTFIL